MVKKAFELIIGLLRPELCFINSTVVPDHYKTYKKILETIPEKNVLSWTLVQTRK